MINRTRIHILVHLLSVYQLNRHQFVGVCGCAAARGHVPHADVRREWKRNFGDLLTECIHKSHPGLHIRRNRQYGHVGQLVRLQRVDECLGGVGESQFTLTLFLCFSAALPSGCQWRRLRAIQLESDTRVWRLCAERRAHERVLFVRRLVRAACTIL